MTQRTVKVEMDPDAPPVPPSIAGVRAAMDTAWRLLREAAVESVVVGLRESIAERAPGRTPPSDEVILHKVSQVVGHPVSYRELAPKGCPEAQETFADLFVHLAEEVAVEFEEILSRIHRGEE